MTPYNDAIQMFNQVCHWILNTAIQVQSNQSIDVLQLILFMVIAGAIIYAMANKEA